MLLTQKPVSKSSRRDLRAKESSVFGVRAEACAHLDSHGCAALDQGEAGEVSGVILAAVKLPAGDVGNTDSIGWGWSDGRCGCGGVGVDLRGDGLGEEGQARNGTDGAGAEGGMHFSGFGNV